MLRFFKRLFKQEIDAQETNENNSEKDIEHIVCSAIKRKERRKTEREPYLPGQNDILDIECGLRHHEIFLRFEDELKREPNAQGFLTSKGRFVDRIDAMKIAYESGQVPEDIAFYSGRFEYYDADSYRDKFSCLFSEHLY